jgi:FkbM family methyltransferase
LNVLFGARGALLEIGGKGSFRFSPEYMFRGLENFGSGHNGGFAECIDACAGKGCFFDVGAHIGYYSLPASRKLAPGGKVYAFEPDSSNFRTLNRHVGYNGIGNIETVNAVVGGDSRQSIEFFEHIDQGSPFGGVTVNRKIPKSAFRAVHKPQISIDDFCSERGIAPDVVKIDVEGGEWAVLKGAERTFRTHSPLIFLSLHPAHLENLGLSVAEVIGLVKAYGYQVRGLGGTGAWKPGNNECICVKESA